MLATVLHRTPGYTGGMVLGDGTVLTFVNGQAGPTTITFADAQSLTVMGFAVVTTDTPSTGYDLFTDQLVAPIVTSAASATRAVLDGLYTGGGGIAVASTVTASGALVASKHNPVDATTGAKAMTLPTGTSGKLLSVEKADASTNAVTVTGNIRGVGSTTISLVWQNEDLLFASDTSGSWWPVAGHKTKTALDTAYGNPLDAGYDIIVCAGQSIMSGRGGPVDTTHYDVSDPRIWQYAQAGSYANTISSAIEPLGYPDSPSGVGLGLGFARWYLRAVAPNRQVLLLPVAHGGVPFEGASSPDVGFTWKVGRHDVTNIYDTTLTFIQTALAAAGPNSRVVAVLWAHGETDGVNTTSGATYQADLDALIAQFRTDLSLPNLPFIISGMVPEYLTTGTRAAIDTVQAATPGRVANTAYVYGVWDQASGDGSHYAVAGPRQVAVSMFRGWVNVAKGGPAVTAPAPTPITLTTTAGNAQVTISGTGGHGYSGTTFALYRGTTPTGTAIAAALPFTDTGRTNGTSYSYVAKATNAQGTVVSNIATATPAVAPGAGVTDSFDRANSTTSLGVADSGQTWVASQGTWGINTNKAYCISAASADHAIIDSGLTDVAVQATLTGTSGSTNPTLILRSDSAGANYYMCNFGNGFATVYKVVSGTPTNLGSTSMTLADGDVLKFTCAGTTLTAFKNGTQVITKTDATFTTGTYVGIRIGSGSSAVRFDSFSAA